MRHDFRPAAVPLATVDPYFSVWSMADRLTDDFTRHWTGQRHAMTGLLRIDGETHRFAGKVEPNANRYYTEPPAMRQAKLDVTPLSTVYAFEAEGVELTVRFTTPLLLDDLDALSRPASYVAFAVRSTDGQPHDVQLYFDITGEWCVDRPTQSVVGERGETAAFAWMRMGHEKQEPLNRSGDDARIDWGYAYLCAKRTERAETRIGSAALRKSFVRRRPSDDELSMPCVVDAASPVMAVSFDLGEVGAAPAERLVVLAYDDILSIEYFGERLPAYWRRDGKDALAMIAEAFEQYESLSARADAFGAALVAEAKEAGGERYADLLALSYRQSIAAHKLVLDSEGEPLFLSKECYSNGCMATVDVSYPSIPLYLLYNPTLVEGMMRPIFQYVETGKWPFAFAPHDIGQYPLGNGQVYGENALEYQMPIEECGNMLLMAAAVTLASGRADFVSRRLGLLRQWADYLTEFGLDPENQLCTDDFAGHLARNANLSAKAVMGVMAFALLLEKTGAAEEAERYRAKANEMADAWKLLADDGDHTVLAFGRPGTWSLKYNLVWDVLFGTGLFGRDVVSKEVAWYVGKRNAYGTPLDSRETYTKADWLVWAACLAEKKEDFEALVDPLWDMLNATPDRVPFSDWTDTVTAKSIGFQHRSVVGGLFMKLVKDKGLVRADRN